MYQALLQVLALEQGTKENPCLRGISTSVERELSETNDMEPRCGVMAGHTVTFKRSMTLFLPLESLLAFGRENAQHMAVLVLRHHKINATASVQTVEGSPAPPERCGKDSRGGDIYEQLGKTRGWSMGGCSGQGNQETGGVRKW